MKLLAIVDGRIKSLNIHDFQNLEDREDKAVLAFMDAHVFEELCNILDTDNPFPPSSSEIIFVRRGEDIVPVKAEEISAISTGSDVVVIHMRDGKEILGDRTLKEYEPLLDPMYFKRISRQWIINTAAIIKLTCSMLGNGHIFLEPDVDIVLSREKYSQVVKMLTDQNRE